MAEQQHSKTMKTQSLLYLSRADTDSREITIALNLGLALEDMAAAILVCRAATEKRIGQLLPL